MSSLQIRIGAAAIVMGVIIAAAYLGRSLEADHPGFNPDDFTTRIDNPYFALPIGKKMIYEARTDDGLERVEVTITGETRTVMGIETLVYLDREFVGDKLHEVTKDFLAQDRDGNVWYFGEEVDNYLDGHLRDHRGSWLAGRNGAKPGIWIKSNLVPGDSYQQERSPGEAEDFARVVSVGETVSIGAGDFENCAMTLEWTPIEPNVHAYKYYCPELGGLALMEHLRTGDRVELIEVSEADRHND